MGHGFELRKKQILERLGHNGSILVKDLANELGISETTIRRDLNELDAMNLLRQVYGGAVRAEKQEPRIESPISGRMPRQRAAKRGIGQVAATFVDDNDILYIDPGTTSWEMIPYLKEKKNLTIISNSVRLLQCLEYIGHHQIVQLGGSLRPDRLDTVGSLCVMGIDQLRGYKAFQGGDGIERSFGLSAVDRESAMVGRAICANAKKTFVVADHTKFENPQLLYKILEIDEIDTLITDRKLTDAWEDRCFSASINVVIAGEQPA